MPSPSIVFGFILATLYGSTFHLFAGGDARRLALFLLGGWLGFSFGQIMGEILGIQIYVIGAIHVFSASVVAFLSLLIVWFLSRREKEE